MASAPTISGTLTTSIAEGGAASYLKTGSLTFSDVDAGSVLTPALGSAALLYKSSAGLDQTTVLSNDLISTLVNALSFTMAPSYASGGSMSWKYAIPDTSLDFLGSGESLTITVPLTVTDQTGLSSTQNIVVTLRGTNDVPTLTAATAADTSASFTEAASTLGSTATYSAQGLFKIADLDLTDTHSVSITPRGTGYLGTLSTVLVDTSAGNPGTVTWTYSAQDKLLDGLADGQVVNQVYTITLTDKKGGSVTQDVTIKLVGTEDVPVVTGTFAGSVSEGAATSYNLVGNMTVSDADLTDRPVVSILSQDFSYKNASSVDVTSVLGQSVIDQLRNAFSMPVGAMATNKGVVTWNYSVADSAIDFLGRSETVTIKTTIQIDDQHGGVVTKDIVITLRGINDNVILTNSASPTISASVVEASGVTNSAATSVATGAIGFTDADITDKHLVTVTAQGSGYVGKFATTLNDTVNGTNGAVNWNYSVADKALDYLAQGETLTQVYRVAIADGKGSTTTQDITIVNVGTDDAAQVTGVTHADYYQALNSSHAQAITLDGTLKIADADASDVVSVSTSTVHITVYDDHGVDLSTIAPDQLTPTQSSMLAQAQSLGNYLSVNSSSAANAGQVTWSYAASPDTISFLQPGYHVQVSTNATITSSHANGGQPSVVTQPIVVDLHGTDTTFQAKDYVSQVVNNTFLQNLPANVSIGNQDAAADLRSYKTLGAADGINVRSNITLEVTKDGAVFDGVDFRNVQLSVLANNVKFINCIFNATTDLSFSIRSATSTTGLYVDHCTFDGEKANSKFQDFVIAQGTYSSITSNVFLNAPSDAISTVGGVVSGNYFQGGGYFPTAHADAIWVGKTVAPVVIENNIVDWRSPADAPAGTNNAVRISSELGNIDNVLIQKNVLLGGNYTITATNGPTWFNTADQMGTLTNLVIKDNIVDLGRTGEFDPQYVPTGTVYTGNAALWGIGEVLHQPSADAAYPLLHSSVLAGTTFADTLIGTAGDDYISGGSGQDTIYGGAGNDTLEGGSGRDYLFGGTGADVFLFRNGSNGTDFIRDFEQGVDKIDISGIAAGYGNVDWYWAGNHHFTGLPFQITFVQNTASGITSLLVDVNGDTVYDFRVDLTGLYTLTSNDLIVNRTLGPSDPAGGKFYDTDVNTTNSSLTMTFSFKDAPLQVINGQVVLVHADGTIMPIGGLATYTFADGVISTNDGNGSVDDLFYFASHKELWGTGIDPDSHYATVGWQQGYDPDAYFSTRGYVAAHSAATGINPLDYYRTIGWKLGDNPSANFNTKMYLLMNQDVLSSGLDPLEHYLTIGQAQGRVIYAAIGSNIVNGFDAEYYLLANPSVASSGLSPLDHYLSIGWKQGLKPNAYFDPNFYVMNNQDVAMSGVEPLSHFMSIGWKEGRDPSASFDVSSYLAANPDVAASGVNPLIHFLTVGIYEGRAAFASGVDLNDTAPVTVNDAASVDGSIGAVLSSPASVLANDSDADQDKLKVVSVNGSIGNLGAAVQGKYGILTLGADGTYSYQVNSLNGPTGSHLVDTFKYVVTDGKSAFNSAALNITLNRATVAADDAAVTKSGAGALSASAANGVLANDKDADGDLLQVVSVGGAANGVGSIVHGQYGDLLLNADGSYTYTQNGTAPRSGGVSDSFTYSVADGYGSVSTAKLVINVASANTAPTLGGATSGAILESSASSYALTGKLNFADADSGDTLTASVASQSVTLADQNGIDVSSTLTADQIAKITAAFAVPTGSVGNTGSLDWTYQVADSALHFLSAGDVLTYVVRVQVQDPGNEVAYQDVTIKITGTNDKPVFDTVNVRDPNVYMGINEPALETGSLNSQTKTGVLYFTDLDARDVHSVSVATKASGYLGTMSAQVLQEPSASGSGIVMTTFTVPDKRLDSLAAGQTATQTYTVTVTDSKGAITKQDVTVVLTGAEDLPTIAGSTKLSWVEGQAASYVKTGALTFSDVDLTDRLTTSIGAQSIVLKAVDGSDITSMISDSQAVLLKNAFSMPVGDLGKNTGSANWTYAINDSALDFLGENDILTVNSTVQVDDGMGGTASQVVSVSVRGINDAPTVKSYVSGDAAIAATVNELPAANGKTTLDTAAGSFTFKDADYSDKHTVTIKAAGTGYIGTLTANVATDTTGGKDGAISWQFSTADKALDFLTAGQQLTQTYTISISDGKSGLVKQDVTITLTGASEQYLFTGPTAQTISNFTPNTDKLAFVSSAFGNYAVGTLDASHFVSGTAAVGDTSAQFVYDATKGKLYYDADGIGSGASVLVATLNGNPALHFNDLLIV